METVTDKCVVLKTSDYRDDDKLAKILTATHGLITVLFRGVKKSKAKLKSFAQEFSVFDAVLVSGRSAFVTVIEPMLIRDGFLLCSDLKVFTAASVAAEATMSSICDEESHTGVFIEFLKLLNFLESGGDPYYQAAVYMTRLLADAGFYKEYNSCDNPLTPVQMLGRAQRVGYEKSFDRDLSRRALKYICGEFEHNFDIGLKSKSSIDLYN